MTAKDLLSTTTNPIALIIEAKRLNGELNAVLDELRARLETSEPPTNDGAPLKRPDGRMTEAGIDALYAEFATKKLTNLEIAEKFDISLSGVVKRKSMWNRGER
ncbi:MAG TPA: hypothetical protein VD978_13405 [Azospirillum sp.]|nr:hypothetical protein [Azospirillum sp.]